jgi:hypothetical protein
LVQTWHESLLALFTSGNRPGERAGTFRSNFPKFDYKTMQYLFAGVHHDGCHCLFSQFQTSSRFSMAMNFENWFGYSKK